MLWTQLTYDLKMFSREIFYLIFTIIIPPVTYIFMGQIFGDQSYAGNLNYAETYTPSFILLITFGVVFFAFGYEEVMHRSTGIEKRIRMTPVPKNLLLLSNILKSIIITSIGFMVIYLIGVIAFDLTIHPMRFVLGFSFFIFLNAVLLLLSSAIYSLFNNINAALVFSIVVFQVVMITGGFAMPIHFMPAFVQTMAEVNPLYHMNRLFIAIWNGQLTEYDNRFVSLAYTLLLIPLSIFVIRFQYKKRS